MNLIRSRWRLPESRLRGRLVWLLAGIALAAAFLLVSVRSLNVYDEGLVLTGAEEISAGAVPHRDFYVNYGPAQFAIVAGLFRLFGATVLVERIWDALVRAAIVLLVFRLSRPFGNVAAWIAALSCFLWLASIASAYGYALFPALAAALGAAVLFGEMASSFAAGLCLGIAFLFRYDVGIACLAASGAALWLSADLSQWRETWRAFCRIVAGFAALAVPLFLVFALAGALSGWWFDVVAFPARNYARMRSLPFPGWADLRGDPEKVSVYAPPLAMAAALALLLQRAWIPSFAERRRLWIITLLTAALYVKAWVRISPVHVSAAFVTSVVLMAQLSRRGLRALLAVPALAAIGVSLVTAWPDVLARVTDNLRFLSSAEAWVAAEHPEVTGSDSCRPGPLLARAACIRIDGPTAATLAYIRQHTPSDSRLLVALPRHDRVFANDIALYFLADRLPATRYYHDDPGLQTSRLIQRAMIADLEQRPPALVVVEDIFQNVIEPNDSVLSSGVRDLDEYLDARFRPVASFGRYAVLKRASGGPGSARDPLGP